MTTNIYSLIDPRDEMIRYIGKADDCDKRLEGHIKKTKYETNHKANWIKGLLKENLKPILEIIDEVQKSEWEFWERHYISLYKSWGFDLTNSTMGGDGGTMSPEILKIISNKNKGHLSYNKGVPCKESTKEKIRQKRKLQIITEETKSKLRIAHSKRMKQVFQCDLQWNLIKEWNSVREPSDELNITYQSIQSVCHGRMKTTGGFIWIFKSEIEKNPNLLEERKQIKKEIEEKRILEKKQIEEKLKLIKEAKLNRFLTKTKMRAEKAVELFNSFNSNEPKIKIKRIKTPEEIEKTRIKNIGQKRTDETKKLQSQIKLSQSDSISKRMKEMWANTPLERRSEINNKISKKLTGNKISEEEILRRWLINMTTRAKKQVELFNRFNSNTDKNVVAS